MISTPPPGQVGVQVPGRQEERLVGVQVDPVHQQRGEYAGVAGIELADLGRGPGELPELAGLRHPAGRACTTSRTTWRWSVPRPSSRPKTTPSRSTAGTDSSSGAARPGRIAAGTPSRSNSAYRLGRVAEAAQRLGLPQGAQHLRLGPAVAVDPVRRVTRHAGRLLPGVPRLGLLSRRMGLQRERLVGGDDLEQERQPGSEARHRGGADRRPPGRGRPARPAVRRVRSRGPADARRTTARPAARRSARPRAARGSPSGEPQAYGWITPVSRSITAPLLGRSAWSTADRQRSRVRATARVSAHGTVGDSPSPARMQRITSWAWKV